MDWNKIKAADFDPNMPVWAYQLCPGDELMKPDGSIVYFERAMQKNIAFTDNNGKKWKSHPCQFIKWRKGSPDNVPQSSSSPKASKWNCNPSGVNALRPGDYVLIIISETRNYVGRFERATGKKIHWTDLRGKSYSCDRNFFVCKLPSESFS